MYWSNLTLPARGIIVRLLHGVRIQECLWNWAPYVWIIVISDDLLRDYVFIIRTIQVEFNRDVAGKIEIRVQRAILLLSRMHLGLCNLPDIRSAGGRVIETSLDAVANIVHGAQFNLSEDASYVEAFYIELATAAIRVSEMRADLR